MAKKYNIQYVNFYTDGSAARKIAPVLHSENVVMPKQKKQKRKVIYLDPVAVLGMAVAVCMLLMMIVGLAQLTQARGKAVAMEQYVIQLDIENDQLDQMYHDGYDIAEVERTALALGMVPGSQVKQTSIVIPVEEPVVEAVSLWDQIGTFLSSLFA